MKHEPGPHEMEFDPPCQDCGCHAVFIRSTQAGRGIDRRRSFHCCQCGNERADLNAHFGRCLEDREIIRYGKAGVATAA
jgi:hypothetical protein